MPDQNVSVFHSCESLLSMKISFYDSSIQNIFNILRGRSLILPGEGVEDIHEGVEDIHEGGPKFCTLRGRGMKNKKHFKRRSLEFLLKSWSGNQNVYINLTRGDKKSIKYIRMSSSPSPEVINDPSLTIEEKSPVGPMFSPEVAEKIKDFPQFLGTH